MERNERDQRNDHPGGEPHNRASLTRPRCYPHVNPMALERFRLNRVRSKGAVILADFWSDVMGLEVIDTSEGEATSVMAGAALLEHGSAMERTFVAVAHCADGGPTATATLTTLAELTGLARSTISRDLERLLAIGVLWLERGGNQDKQPSVYGFPKTPRRLLRTDAQDPPHPPPPPDPTHPDDATFHADADAA